LLILLGLGGAALYFGVSRKPPPAPVVLHPTPRQAGQARRHMIVLRDQFLAPLPPANHRPRAARPNPAVLQLSESDLNNYLAGDPDVKAALAGHGIQAVQFLLLPPSNLTVRAFVIYRKRPMNVQISGALTADPVTALQFTATEGQIGRLPLPVGVLSAQANKIAAGLVPRAQGRLRFHVRHVSVKDHQLLLAGVQEQIAP